MYNSISSAVYSQILSVSSSFVSKSKSLVKITYPLPIKHIKVFFPESMLMSNANCCLYTLIGQYLYQALIFDKHFIWGTKVQ